MLVKSNILKKKITSATAAGTKDATVFIPFRMRIVSSLLTGCLLVIAFMNVVMGAIQMQQSLTDLHNPLTPFQRPAQCCTGNDCGTVYRDYVEPVFQFSLGILIVVIMSVKPKTRSRIGTAWVMCGMVGLFIAFGTFTASYLKGCNHVGPFQFLFRMFVHSTEICSVAYYTTLRLTKVKIVRKIVKKPVDEQTETVTAETPTEKKIDPGCFTEVAVIKTFEFVELPGNAEKSGN